jgi:hypothetical protein
VDIYTYTTGDEIRAALGVSSLELKDSQLELNIYGELLFQEMSAVTGVLAPDTVTRDLAGHYSYISGLVTKTTNQNLMLSYIRTFSTYVVASKVASTISLLAPKTISDGKALMTRFSSERTFEAVIEGAYSQMFDLKRKIQELLGVAPEDKVYLGVVVPAIDVVTDLAYE